MLTPVATLPVSLNSIKPPWLHKLIGAKGDEMLVSKRRPTVWNSAATIVIGLLLFCTVGQLELCLMAGLFLSPSKHVDGRTSCCFLTPIEFFWLNILGNRNKTNQKHAGRQSLDWFVELELNAMGPLNEFQKRKNWLQ